MNTKAIGLVIDLDQIENKREFTVNEYEALLYEIGDWAYLCWTLTPEISCVIGYGANAVKEDNIFRMSESVPLSMD